MVGSKKVTGEQARELLQSRPMQNIFANMQKTLRIKPLEAKQVTIRKPYIQPSTTVKSKYVAPNTILFENPEYLAQQARQAAFRDMADSGIRIDARLEHPE
jgi:hypothetical protein